MKEQDSPKGKRAHRSVSDAYLDTLAVHAGERETLVDAPVFPIWQTATYAFRDYAEIDDFLEGRSQKSKYGRYGNPTQKALERKLAALERAEGALVFASGMNALTTTLLALLKPGDHAVYCDSCYRATLHFFSDILPAFGIRTTCVPPANIDALRAAIQPATKAVFFEAPTNVLLRFTDVGRLVHVSKKRPGVTLIVDSTFATPINLRPIDHGADLVIHSLTKYLGGHDDLLGGAVCGSHERMSHISAYRDVLGGIPDPHNTFLLLRSLKTFVLRCEKLNENGLTVARFLQKHKAVKRLFYPGLPSHPDYRAARKFLKGFGSVMYFELHGGSRATKSFIEGLRMPYIATNFGGVHTLVEPVSRLTYGNLTADQREALGVGENMIRLCVGIESAEEIIEDIAQALSA